MDLNHLHLHVKDLEKSQIFYQNYFGFQERIRQHNILFLRNPEGFELALMPESKPNIFPFWFHFGFRLNQPEEVRKLYDQMQKEKVLIEKPIFEDEEFVSFRCLDPDEYKIEVYWEKEG